MSLKPIDYQVMFPKVNELSRDLSGQMGKYNAIQRQQADRLNENAQEEQKQVRDRENIRQVRVEKREEGENQKRERQKKEKQDGGTDNENNEGLAKRVNNKGAIIDIKL
jgi:hypothetical protein